ncbi:hypothetical protein JL722_9533 [Aureococcus anophagefferens]|nr:hypothetical protein JL722_9533 [Aureococcus anophagefferens]
MSQSVAIKLKTSTAQPSDAEVEELFGRVLVALCLPAAAVANLTANESVANKWRMVQMNAALLESGRSTQMSDGDAALLEAIRRDGLALLASTLAVALAGPAHRFGEKDGCLALAALGCVRCVTNHARGLDRGGRARVYDAVARAAFHAPHSFCGGAVAAVALELLAVGSHFGKAAAVRAALPSLEALAAVGGAAPVEVRAAALTLANEVVSGGDDLETRAALRFALRACFDGAAAAETSGSDLAKSTLGRMVGTKATKRRVYTIKHGRLSWADDDAGTSGGAPKRRGSATDEARFVDLATVKAVRAYSDEGGLGGLCAFEVVAEKKTLALAAETRSDKDAWLDVKVAVDRAALARDVGDREAFFAIADADRAEALSRGGVDLSDAAAVLGRVAAGAAKAGKARAVGELAIAALKALDDATAARWEDAVAATFVDPRVAQNVGIALKKLRLKPSELARAVADGDDVLTNKADLIPVPSGDDLDAAKDYDPSITALRDKLGDVLDACGAVAAAAAAARESDAVRLALAAALAVGNYLNGGSGEAGGFDLDGVAKLATTKGADGTTLAMHVVAGVDRRDSGAVARLAALEPALDGRARSFPAVADLSAWLARSTRRAPSATTKQPFDLFRKLLTLVRTLKTAHEANRRRAKPKADAKGGDLFDAFSKTQDDASSLIDEFKRRCEERSASRDG